jgi:hypothetical protein
MFHGNIKSVYIRGEANARSEFKLKPGMVVHAYNPSTWEAEAGRS